MAKSTPAHKNKSGERTKVLPCSCAHQFQDMRYGSGRRVHNPSNKGFRCTVCGKYKA